MDENNPAGTGLAPWNSNELRKEILYDVYFSGGNIEWYAGYHELPVGGDMRLEDFRTREEMWNYTWYARRFMEENLPFWDMVPADHLLENETEVFGGGQVFAKEGELYAVYLPNAESSGNLVLDDVGEVYLIHWYNPRTGIFEGKQRKTIITNETGIKLGTPPSMPQEDWVILVRKESATLTLEPYP
jgi:hypothetical protein